MFSDYLSSFASVMSFSIPTALVVCLILASNSAVSATRAELLVDSLSTGDDFSPVVGILKDDDQDCPLFYSILEKNDINEQLILDSESLDSEDASFYLTTVYMSYALISEHRFRMQNDLCYTLVIKEMELPAVMIRLPAAAVRKVDGRDFGQSDQRALKRTEKDRSIEPPYPLSYVFSEALLYGPEGGSFQPDEKLTKRYLRYLSGITLPYFSDGISEASVEDVYALHLDALKRSRRERVDVKTLNDSKIDNAKSCSQTVSFYISLGDWYSDDLFVRTISSPEGTSQYSEDNSSRSHSLDFQSYADACISGRYMFSVSMVDKGVVSNDKRAAFQVEYNVPPGVTICNLSTTTTGGMYGSCR